MSLLQHRKQLISNNKKLSTLLLLCYCYKFIDLASVVLHAMNLPRILLCKLLTL